MQVRMRKHSVMMKTWRCACVCMCDPLLQCHYPELGDRSAVTGLLMSLLRARQRPGVISGTADTAHPEERILLADTLGWQGCDGLVLTGISLAYVHTQDGCSPVSGVIIARYAKSVLQQSGPGWTIQLKG